MFLVLIYGYSRRFFDKWLDCLYHGLLRYSRRCIFVEKSINLVKRQEKGLVKDNFVRELAASSHISHLQFCKQPNDGSACMRGFLISAEWHWFLPYFILFTNKCFKILTFWSEIGLFLCWTTKDTWKDL